MSNTRRNTLYQRTTTPMEEEMTMPFPQRNTMTSTFNNLTSHIPTVACHITPPKITSNTTTIMITSQYYSLTIPMGQTRRNPDLGYNQQGMMALRSAQPQVLRRLEGGRRSKKCNFSMAILYSIAPYRQSY